MLSHHKYLQFQIQRDCSSWKATLDWQSIAIRHLQVFYLERVRDIGDWSVGGWLQIAIPFKYRKWDLIWFWSGLGSTFSCIQILNWPILIVLWIGLKFIIFTDSAAGIPSHEMTCVKLYEIYSDFAMKNPFYTAEMPIRAELFDTNISKFVSFVNGGNK